MQQASSQTFCGRAVSEDKISEIIEIVETCQGLSRAEFANTVCELFCWKRPTGRLKIVECRQFLEHLDAQGIIHLPERSKKGRPKGAKTKIRKTSQAVIQTSITGKLGDLCPILLRRVDSREQRELWYDYIDRYHHLGYQLPFGAQLRYFIEAGTAHEHVLGCVQISSPAWKMAPRDKWIKCNDEQRKRNLQKIINNSRFLIFPWVKVKNLASLVLALAAKTVPDDW